MSKINFKREDCINRILKTFATLKEKNLGYDRKKLLVEIMKNYTICEKTAIEYLNTAISFSEQKKEDNILEDSDEIA